MGVITLDEVSPHVIKQIVWEPPNLVLMMLMIRKWFHDGEDEEEGSVVGETRAPGKEWGVSERGGG